MDAGTAASVSVITERVLQAVAPPNINVFVNNVNAEGNSRVFAGANLIFETPASELTAAVSLETRKDRFC